MTDNDEIDLEFEQTESDEGEIDLSQHKNTNYDSKDPEIRGLYEQYQRGRLIIQPNYQRKYVWDAKKASKLIESILINICASMIYHYKKPASILLTGFWSNYLLNRILHKSKNCHEFFLKQH